MQPAGVASAFSIASLTAGLSHHHPQPYPHPAAVTTSAMMCPSGYPPAALPLPYTNATSCPPVSYGASLALPPPGTTCTGRSAIDMSVLSATAGTQCAMNNQAGGAGGGSMPFPAHHPPTEPFSRQCGTDSATESNRNLSLLPNSRQGLTGVTDLSIPRWNSYGTCLESGISSAISSRVPNGLDSTPASLGLGIAAAPRGNREFVDSLTSSQAGFPPQIHSPTGKQRTA